MDRVGDVLTDDEDLVAIVATFQRLIAVTSRRLLLLEKSGDYSVIRNNQISSIEVSDGRGQEKFLKIYFGGGLSRTISVPGKRQATAIVSAAAR
ncbi:hypothetical protein BA895_19850 [Humibacillus sp. DSM 29435]|nr:hypothetical protein BA895_19850 [Humibacillus sp. DSM 29435]